ncbi:sulfatase [candidate division KSB1 bacterium]|nr:sulfatase [candidate division KSB1 bacterium]
MNRRKFLSQLALTTAAISVTPIFSCGNLRNSKPNFIFFLIDDLGWKDVGFMGSSLYETPHIDRLAHEGVIFTNAYSNAPNCAPTRACLMSGQYGPRHGIYTVGTPERGNVKLRKLIPIANKTELAPEVVTFAEVLQQAGYRTASIGKWHLGKDPGTGPISQGFDVNIGGNLAGAPSRYFSPYRNKNLPDGPEGEYLTDRLTDEALKFIEANRQQPFFLYLPHYAVHVPLQAKDKLIEKYKAKLAGDGQHDPVYAAMIESLDDGIGRILNKLDETGLAKNTVVVFFSDNGGHPNFTCNEPLHGGKGQLYEGGIRVPCAIRWPEVAKPGTTSDEPVIGIDFYPTFLEMAGIPPAENHLLDGVSMLSLLIGAVKLNRDAIFFHFPAYLEPYNEKQLPWRTTPASAIRAGDWKLIEFFEDERLELYNLRDDIGEKRNLADDFPDKIKELHQQLLEWRRKTNAPVPDQKNPLYDPKAKAIFK